MAMIEDDGVELELGLSLGGSYGARKAGPPGLGLGGLDSDHDLKEKRGIQAMRRQEAKKKRDEKQLKRALSKGMLPSLAPAVAGSPPANFVPYSIGYGGGFSPVEEPEFKKSKTGFIPGTPPDALQIGLGQNGVTPSWFVTAAAGGTDKNVIRPVARYGFRGAFGHDSEQNGGGGVVGSNGSTVCSSSAGSDNRSPSREGNGSIDSRSHSSILVEQPHSNGVKTHSDHHTAQSDPFKPKEESKSDNEAANNNNNTSSVENPDQVPDSNEHVVGNQSPCPGSLPQMPCVSTTGNGPNGKTVHGFLYRYSSKAEVSIVCVCHGSSFSPAEFVEHAGGVDVLHPLKHITVVPSAF